MTGRFPPSRGGGVSIPVPRPVRAAGLLVLLQGLVGIVIAGWLLVVAIDGPRGPVPVWATAAMLALFGVLVLAVGVLLALGRHGARTPAIVTQLLLLGACWYAVGPSSQPAYGIAAAVCCIAVLVLLFCPPAVRWASAIDTARRAR